ncbi:MAG: hypothetical protein RQ736_08405 [Thiogranum sp.]|nr:hypothetical protein [Thiogranum sp.]
MIAADLRLVEANALQRDEAALTGESVAADKAVEALPGPDTPLGERRNMVYKGTAITQGSGSGVVVAIGKRLSAVETPGAANLVVTDKTGTLTENHMSLSRLALARGTVDVKSDDGASFRSRTDAN